MRTIAPSIAFAIALFTCSVHGEAAMTRPMPKIRKAT